LVDICCASLVLLILAMILLGFIGRMVWRYLIWKPFSKKKGRHVYSDRSGRTVVDIEDKDPIMPHDRSVQKETVGDMVEKTGMALQSPSGRRGLKKIMYSSVSYSTKDGRKWGKVVITEKDGERTLERYGDLAVSDEKEKDFVDVEADEGRSE